MIAASEPLEFIPRGRQTAAENPGSSVAKKPVQFSTENLLLNRLKNVNLSSDAAANTEFWCVQDFNKDITKVDQAIQTTAQVDATLCSRDNEHELYVKGCVAIWTKGCNPSVNRRMPITCFTCDSPIRYAFFCSRNFFTCPNPDKREAHKRRRLYEDADLKEPSENFGICLIDSDTLRVYSPGGEDYRTSFPFPVSNVLQTKYGLLLEKNASSAVIDNTQSVDMPCIHSLSHPLNDVSPVLIKHLNGHVSFVTDANMKIAFTVIENDLVMLYDGKLGRHILCKLRKATQEEKQKVGVSDEDGCASELNFTNMEMHLLNSMRFDGASPRASLSGRRNLSMNRQSSGDSLSLHTSKMMNATCRSIVGTPYTPFTPFDRSQLQSPYDRLELSSNNQTPFLEEEHKAGFAKPSKPIIPEMCLDSIWVESGSREFPDVAARGFLHVDLIGQKYLCYLLKRSGALMMIRLEKSNTPGIPIIGRSTSIPAKDALCVSALKLVIVLGHCGSILLYSGATMVGKVDIGVQSMQQSQATSKPSRGSFPRRSSLLPTVTASTESSFDDDQLHLLSPVYPLQPQYSSRSGNFCIGFKDVASNRITLEYTNNLMYRISLPLLSECPLVTKCLVVLRSILKKDVAMAVISKWYSIRNTPGSQDLSYEREWTTFHNYLLNSLGRTFMYGKVFPSIQIAGQPRLSLDEPKKRRKTDDSAGTDNDFKFLQAFINAGFVNKMTTESAADTRKSTPTTGDPKLKKRNDLSSILSPYIPIVFFSFHLLYEEMKLDETLKIQRTLLSEFLNQLALDLKLDSYCLHYFLDNPDLVYMYGNGCIVDIDTSTLHDRNCLAVKMPSIYDTINELFCKKRKDFAPYPYIPNVNPLSKRIIDLVALTVTEGAVDGTYNFNSMKTKVQPIERVRNKLNDDDIRNKAMQQLLAMNMSRKEMSRFPPIIHYLLAEILEKCRIDPPHVIDSKAFELILRPELHRNTVFDSTKEALTCRHSNFKNENSLTLRAQTSAETTATATTVTDGMSHIYTKLMRLRFPKDLRIEEVRQLLGSSSPVTIDIVQKVGVSDHDFIEEKEKQLLGICTRTMALPVGRGMVTLQSNSPSSTESFQIPKLCLSGKEKDKGGIIELQQIELPPNMNQWPLFHNGVAAGLQLDVDSKEIDSAWIVYNKPKTQGVDGITEHAGFLMALGLNGHLKILSSMSVYDYLVKCDEMTNLGIIIGMSAGYRGTMDTSTTRLLSIHIEALLPPTALELDISQNVQIAAIMGIGLLYQGTAKRHIAEVLLQEIGRPPGPEMENCVERESYALTAGLALGLVTLGKGESPPGLKDLQLPDVLHYYMVGGNKRPLMGSQREKYKFQSFQVREGDTVNIDVTAPGATLALGLMFFQTGNTSVASWMNPPDTTYLLDFVRPDLLLLRIIARSLILWDDISPTQAWLDSQFPSSLKFDLKKGPFDIDDDYDTDHEAICQAYCNIIAGGAFCIGLRYAGTQNEEANKTLDNTFKLFLNMNGIYVGEYAGKSTVESCLMLILLASSLVNAGCGDLNVLRRCRMLRSRLGAGFSHVTYGSHMAVHMAIGFQFLGAGRYTVSRSPEAIASLIISLFPKFPTHSNDNRYHLQALRHLYVLALEPRIVLPRDIDTGKLCLCNVTYTMLDGQSFSKMAPCMLPELSELSSVRFEDPNYWLIKFEKGRNWNELERIIQKCRCIDIKQRAGCVSHIDDPTNLRSTFAHTLSTERYVCWRTHPLNLLAFTNDSKVQNFINKFLTSEDELGEDSKFLQLLMLQFYHCLTKDTTHALYIYIDLLISFFRLMAAPDYFDICQLKLMQTIVKHRPSNILLSSEHLSALIKRVETFMEKKLINHAGYLQQFLYAPNISFLCKMEDKVKLRNVAALIQFLDIPINIINQIDVGENQAQMDYMKLVTEMKKVNVNTDMTLVITKILNAPGF